MMKTVITSISMSEVLRDRVRSHCNDSGENLTDFYNRAILNQLENDGDFSIRDELEEFNNASEKEC